MSSILHYYGDVVRRLFLTGAVLMLVTLPFLNALLPIPIFFSLLAILVISFAAGFTSPVKRWPIVFDEVVAIIAVIVFEYYAVVYYREYSFASGLFIINQLLALNFFVALYFNTKTLREEPTI